jgi:hypothetical protein
MFLVVLAAACSGQSKTSTTTATAATTIVTTTTLPPSTSTSIATSTVTPPTTRTSAVDKSSGWVALGDNEAVYISWLDRDGKLTGSVQLAIRDKDSNEVTATNRQFTGQHVGNQISLDIAVLGLWQGVLNDKLLTLRLPQKDGTIGELVLIKDGIDSYNAGVRALQANASSARAAVADAAASKQADAELLSAGAAVTDSITKLNSEIEALPGIMVRYDRVSHEKMNASLAAVEAKLASVPLHCTSASFAVTSLESSGSTVYSIRSTLDIATSSAVSRLANLKRDFDRLIAANPALVDSETAAGVGYWTKTAKDAIASAKAEADADDRYADEIVASGKAKLLEVCPPGS